MTKIRNIFACLVHESPECVIDLLRNLHFLDPSSLILLYNGGKNHLLLDAHFPIERYGAVIHPNPRPMVWGKLHDFVLDCVQYALEHHPFDTMTIVDSDQLAVQPGYSDHLNRYLMQLPDVGLLGCSTAIQQTDTKEGPAAAAYREIELWQPFLRRFQNGEQKFVHWTFWPTTVFTADAARELVALFSEDAQLKDLMRRSRIWATEEVIFPTLVALLGFKVAKNPCSYDYVKYQTSYTPEQIKTAADRSDVYWVHPVVRKYDNSNRKLIRMTFNHYTPKSNPGENDMSTKNGVTSELLLRWPILNRMKPIKGWLEEDEADLLMAVVSRVLAKFTDPHAIVEVGSYCGRSTVVLGSVAKALGSEAKVYAIDPHRGRVGAMDQGIQTGTSTLKLFRRNLAAADLNGVVEEIQQYSYNVMWDRPLQFLLIDGLHDYINVARDFYHFEPWIVPGGYVAFHDYADYYPGVKAFVNEILGNGQYRQVMHVRSMMVIERLREPRTAASHPPAPNFSGSSRAVSSLETVRHRPVSDGPAVVADGKPLASCIMPTSDRRPFVSQAIQYFLGQTYYPRELIIVDDGKDGVADLIPEDARIRYLRLDKKLALGAKRNMACRAAAGDIIVHWDDDDWMADWRLRYQVDELLQARADMCGLVRLLFYEPQTNRSWQYTYPQKETPLLAGGSLCYLKRFWQDSPFPEINLGEDTRFIWSKRPKKLRTLGDNTFYIALIHPGNTNPRRTAGRRWRPWDSGKIRDLIGGDWGFYKNLQAAEEDEKPVSELADRIEVLGDEPLVSCIMPTANRRLFLRRAISYFRRQEYRNKELVIVDDGAIELGDLIPPEENIRYLRLDRKATVGYKRNFAVQHSQGEMIAHWDDDDWYAPDRLGYQIEAMRKREANVCGLDTGFFYDVLQNIYWSCTPELHAKMFFADINGRSIMYTKKLWADQARYPDVSLAEDARFLNHLRGRQARIIKLQNKNKLIYIRHRSNAWHFECGKFMDPAAWQLLDVPQFLPSEDQRFYRSLQRENCLAGAQEKK